MAIIWNMSCKNGSFELEISRQGFFLIVIISASRTYYLFFVSCLSNKSLYQWFVLFREFEWFCLQINCDPNNFLSRPRHRDPGLVVVVVYYIQIWNKLEHNNISSHTSLIYIYVPNTLKFKVEKTPTHYNRKFSEVTE